MKPETRQYLASLGPRQWLGYSLLVISSISWLALPVIPFLSMEPAEKVSLGAAVFVFMEVTWWLGIPLLGPEVLDFSRKSWARLKGRFSSRDTASDSVPPNPSGAP